MQTVIPRNLSRLAQSCDFPLYLVGGAVRDFLCGFSLAKNADWDICAPVDEERLLERAKQNGFTVKAVFRATGTVKLADSDGVEYEFTRFRNDRYVRGVHAPAEVTFTDEIEIDARRRDFCCNAVYYHIQGKTFCDPLGGMNDVATRTLRTVRPAEKVFGEDGLRLMRLARFCAQLGFAPDGECMQGATEHARLICDIAPERIFAELLAILHADEKHGVQDAPYYGLSILRDTGVLGHIMPELTAGMGMAQRSDYHKYDVLEHSMRCVRYAPKEIRLCALLHDVGKPYCFIKDGNFYEHPQEGARLARDILNRLVAPKKLTEETALLIEWHMRDFNLQMREGKLRREMLTFYPLLHQLLALKQADFSACQDDVRPAPTVVKWNVLLAQMKAEGVPFTLCELNLSGTDVLKAGYPKQRVGEILQELLLWCAEDGTRNERKKLLLRLKKGM